MIEANRHLRVGMSILAHREQMGFAKRRFHREAPLGYSDFEYFALGQADDARRSRSGIDRA